MTQEQFDRAAVISEKLQALKVLKYSTKSIYKLFYCERIGDGNYRAMIHRNEHIQRHINEYLDQYNIQISKAVDDEINALHKEIEEL